jgi:hypothetical protein
VASDDTYPNDEHADMLRSLYARGKLYDDQEEDEELIDAFSEFVTGWVEVQWDIQRGAAEAPSI